MKAIKNIKKYLSHSQTAAMRSCMAMLFVFTALVLVTGCNKKTLEEQPLFEELGSNKTGLTFNNELKYSPEFNLFKYMYFYNGSGVGVGDFNNDGLPDIFFGSNQGKNKLFINKGKLTFSEETAAVPQNAGWTTGISVVDINNDGLLDVYICQVGNFETLLSKNQLLINKGNNKAGVPIFKDEAEAYGLAFSGFSTQAAFVDVDNDGDLDMFLLNHSVHQNGTFKPRNEFAGTYNEGSGDKIFRNDAGFFTDITKQTGIQSTAIGYGLGVAVADIDVDGYPDIYIGNDFHENDYLYINQKNGTFLESGRSMMMHSSQYSMGVDVADINNDGLPEIISMDMLPSDPYILKRSLGEDAYDIFNFKIGAGYSYQYTRNNLQLNRGNGMFSEVGLYSGVAASDWSWSSLFLDFNNDGNKDLFISNGIPKRMNDIDYINFLSNAEVQNAVKNNNVQEKDMALINKFPEIKLPNKFYVNNGALHFTDAAAQIGTNSPTFSNGAAAADFDNDGDIDIVVSNINAEALLYENKTARDSASEAISVKLKGPPQNINAIGAKLIAYSNSKTFTYEKQVVKGFLSSMETPILIGGKGILLDSINIVWPDRTFETLHKPKPANRSLIFTYKPNLPTFNFQIFHSQNVNNSNKFTDITAKTGLQFLHSENRFSEFDREPLMPAMVSTEGPAVAVGDANNDGLDDVFFGNARDRKAGFYLQKPNGTFLQITVPAFILDSSFEDVSAIWVDVNNDGKPDLVVASGGNEFYGPDEHNAPRIYLNSGNANFTRKVDAFSNIFMTASSVISTDFNGDGFQDLFIGGRAVPFEYGKVPESYLLQNDGTGKFISVTKSLAPELAHAGFVTGATWVDIDADKDADLLLALEWGAPTVFINNGGKFIKKILSSAPGWWNFLLPVDVDADGDLDFVAGNLGLNSRLTASVQQPVKMYYNDFDNNGKYEQLLTYYLNGKEIPFANKAELEKQMPVMKKKFLYAEDFAKASLFNLFPQSMYSKSAVYTAETFANCIFINDGKLNFTKRELPPEAQFSTLKAGVVVNVNDDALPDLVLGGNFYSNNVEMGRYDADFCTVLINIGKGNFKVAPANSTPITGEIRQIRQIKVAGKDALVLARNNDSARIIQFHTPKKMP